MVAAYWGKESLDTEAWVGNNEVLLGQVMLQWLACGQSRVTPWHASMAAFAVNGAARYQMPTPIVTATAAFNRWITGRRFQGMLFRTHLPWAFQFGDDHDAVVVLTGALVPLGRAGSDTIPRTQAQPHPDAVIEIDNSDEALEFFDLNGNREFEAETVVRIPGDARLHYLRARNGGVADIRRKLLAARLQGFRPVEIIARDLMTSDRAPVPNLRVTLHNLLNQPLAGELTVETATGVELEMGARRLELGRGETRDVQFPIRSWRPSANNAYGTDYHFSAEQGEVVWREVIHDTVVRKARIEVDGNLEDWRRVPAILLTRDGFGEGETRRAFDALQAASTNGYFGEFRLAWDTQFLYVAARVHDNSVSALHQRLEDWDEDQYFRSAEDDAVCEQLRPFEKLLVKLPGDAARWSLMAREPDWSRFQAILKTNMAAREVVSSGAAQAYFRAKLRDPRASFANANHVFKKVPWHDRPYAGDTLQIGLDLLPGYEHHRLKSDLDRVPAGFHAWPDTDYEFCAYACADGGTEVWRLMAPGVPRTYPSPRQLKAAKDQGPVKAA
jgi:hypothetical protein